MWLVSTNKITLRDRLALSTKQRYKEAFHTNCLSFVEIIRDPLIKNGQVGARRQQQLVQGEIRRRRVSWRPITLECFFACWTKWYRCPKNCRKYHKIQRSVKGLNMALFSPAGQLTTRKMRLLAYWSRLVSFLLFMWGEIDFSRRYKDVGDWPTCAKVRSIHIWSISTCIDPI